MDSRELTKVLQDAAAGSRTIVITLKEEVFDELGYVLQKLTQLELGESIGYKYPGTFKALRELLTASGWGGTSRVIVLVLRKNFEPGHFLMVMSKYIKTAEAVPE